MPVVCAMAMAFTLAYFYQSLARFWQGVIFGLGAALLVDGARRLAVWFFQRKRPREQAQTAKVTLKYVHQRFGWSYALGQRLDDVVPPYLSDFLATGAFVVMNPCLASRDLLRAILAIRERIEDFPNRSLSDTDGQEWNAALRELKTSITYAEKFEEYFVPEKYKELSAIHEALEKETSGAGSLSTFRELSMALAAWQERNP